MIKDIKLFNQEIDELTELMRNEWSDLKSCISSFGLDPDTTYLVSFCEDEQEQEYGILVTSDKKIFEYVRSTSSSSPHEFTKCTELPNTKETLNLTPTIELALLR